MHGPYRHQLRETGRGSTATVSLDLDPDGIALARRYRVGRGAGAATMRESHVAAVFTAALLVLPGESVEVETVGRVGTEPRAEDVVALRDVVRRETDGTLVSSVGSKFNERRFIGA